MKLKFFHYNSAMQILLPLLVLLSFLLFPCAFIFSDVTEQVRYPSEIMVIGKRIPSVKLYNQDGDLIDLKSFIEESRKRAVILSPVYSNCPHSCSPITQSLRDAVEEILKKGRNDFLVISLSFDEKDTKDDVERFIKRNDLEDFVSAGTWVVLFGDKDGFQKILDAIDFKIERKGEIIDHPNLIVFLTNDLVVSGFLYGTNYYADEVEKKLDGTGKITFFVLLRNFFPVFLGLAIFLILILILAFKLLLPKSNVKK